MKSPKQQTPQWKKKPSPYILSRSLAPQFLIVFTQCLNPLFDPHLLRDF